MGKIRYVFLVGALLLAGCGNSEEEELEKQRQIEQEANEKAVEMVEKYKEEAENKRVSPYTISEMEEGFGGVYKDVRSRIGEFNSDLLKLREDEITVYDINKKISDYRLVLKDYEDVDTLKIPDDYYGFYKEFGEVSNEYINNLESFGNYYQSKDTAGLEEVTTSISSNLTTLYNLEFGIFGTPLGDKILSGEAKERSDKRLKELCTQSVAEDNKEYLDSIALEEVNKSEMDDDELLERKEAEEEYARLMEEYKEDVKADEKECYDKVMEERSTFGNRVVESENADLESELMEMLDSYTERQESENVEDTETEGGESETTGEDSYDDDLLKELEEGSE